MSIGKKPFDEVNPEKLGHGLHPDDDKQDESGEDHRFRYQFEQRQQAQAEAQQPPQPVGEMLITSMTMGGIAVDENSKKGSTIKSFLTKSSSLLTASEGVGELVPDLWFDEVDEKKEQEMRAYAEAISPEGNMAALQAMKTKTMMKQVMLARMLTRLSIANVARHDGLLPPGLTVT
jgi:hypothetical protein